MRGWASTKLVVATDLPTVSPSSARQSTSAWLLFAQAADQCDDDAGVLAEPSRDLVVAPEGRAPISVVDAQQANYAVPADELVSLIAGNTPSAEAPAGFVYTPFPYLLTALNGEVVSIQQIWMP